jgi:hypothetical protein
LPWEAGFWVLATLVMLGVGCLFHFILVPALAPRLENEYDNRALFRSLRGWPGIYMILHPLVYGLFFAGAFRLVGGVARAGTWRRGLLVGACFGLAVFLVGSLPVYLLNFASFAVSPLVIQAWVAQSLCQYVAAGAALGVYSAWVPR